MKLSRRAFLAAAALLVSAQASACPCCEPPLPPKFAMYFPAAGEWRCPERGEWRVVSIEC